ncbi:hypothetical protein [Streptomyces peucetius]|nr:hypothetical protein CGZ69_10035 [Streptomyces peucetius subsp. caesius ATCC 27952]
MGGFFQELAKKLAERWVSLLLVPGALFAAAAWVGVRLGHRHALDWSQLGRVVSDTVAATGRQSAGAQVVPVVAVLLVAIGTGLAVQALAGMTRLVWLGEWPRPLAPFHRRRVADRRKSWREHLQQRRQLEHEYPRETRTTDQQDAINDAADRVNRIALAQPARPTWMGDRMHSVEQVALNRYGLDLSFAWPRLWLVLPDTTRAEITGAHASFAAAVATGTWAWPYLLVGTVWWPAALAGLGIGATGWARARSAIIDLSALAESALDVHGRTLATALGVADENSVGPLTFAEGEQLTRLLRKGR